MYRCGASYDDSGTRACSEATGTDTTLKKLVSTCRAALERGTPLIRLLGNMGWGRRGWPHDEGLLRFEARVTAAAKSFPSVVVCMYDERTPFGTRVLHGALKTHPVIADGNILRVNRPSSNAANISSDNSRNTTDKAGGLTGAPAE